MPEINAATGALTIPIWAVGAVAAVFLVLIMLAIAQAGTVMVMHALSRAAIVIAVASAGWVYVQQMERQEQAAARRALDDRSAALLARAVAPGSALSCLNEVAGDAVEAACEKAVFASPEAVSAAASYVAAELALLADGSDRAQRAVVPAYASEFAPLRAALELDRFGIVSHVLARRGCTAEKCDALDLFNDPSQLVANLRDHVFDDRITKFAAFWNGTPHAAAATSTIDAATAAPLRPATALSPQYDFPSADSIPPVNIMAPEPGARSGTAANQAPPPAGSSRTSAAPVPPRRPPQGRAPLASARPPVHRPAAPVAVGEAPTDGAATPPSQ